MAGDQTGASAEIQQLSQTIAELLTKTLLPDPVARKSAEEALARLEVTSPLYGLATLYLTRLHNLGAEVHIAAAIAFKNFIRRNWPYDPNDETTDNIDRIDSKQRELIKQHLTKFMLESASHIQRQLSEAITIIGHSDFPDRWPSLIVELETFLKTQDPTFNSTQGVLQTAHSIFRKYRYEFQSDRLWSEIKLVMDHFAPPFTERFKDLVAAVKSSPEDPQRLVHIYKSLLLCAKIYRSLITQELPEFFEDRLNIWLPLFIELLNLQGNLPEASSVLEDIKSEICQTASLFVQRYSDTENFKEYAQSFAQNIWNLLVTTGQDVRYDTLVSAAIRYLVTVAERPESRSLFQDANVLNLLCQRVIIPNLMLRETDEELFEDDPDEYVKRDIEGSDVDTRRRAACDLVKVLSKFLELEMIEIFGSYIEEMLRSYETNSTSNYKNKDLAIFLYSSMAIKGSTRQHGTLSISQHVNVEKFFEEKIADELSSNPQQGSPVLKADALRYITTFRNHISLNILVRTVPYIVKHVCSNNVVVRTYACITLEKLLTMRDPTQPNSTAFKAEQLEPYIGELINTLFNALDLPGSQENEHIMKAIMRIFSFFKSSLIVQFLPTVVPKMTNKLTLVAKNPSKPHFNHYLFETLALLIRAACSQDNPNILKEFENVIFAILELVVAQDVQEFLPYVLQLQNLILRAQPDGSISDVFVNLFQTLLSPNYWERSANTTPLTELMRTYIRKSSQFVVSQNNLLPLLGIFQKLIGSKATDHEGLGLLQTMIIYLPADEIDSRIRDIFMLILQRLTGSKTTKFVTNTLVCFSLYAHLRGADLLASALNQLQDRIFGMVLEKLYIADVKKVRGSIEKNICICGLVKIIGQLPLIDNGCYNHLWAPLLLVLMEIFELPPEVVPEEDEHFADITESLDFQAQYSKLNYASIKRDDPTRDVGDFKALLAKSLGNLSTKLPGFVPKVLQESISPGVVSCLMSYCQAANVRIV